jgi:hypothetical protein
MPEFDSLEKYIEHQQSNITAKIAFQKELIASPAYQNEIKFIDRMTNDIILLLRTCLMCSFRGGSYSENSLTIRSTDDLIQSVLAARHLAEQGMINPVKRELRYIIESSVKYLYVDQHTQGLQTVAELTERLAFLDKNVNSSIDAREELKLEALHSDDAKQCVD